MLLLDLAPLWVPSVCGWMVIMAICYQVPILASIPLNYLGIKVMLGFIKKVRQYRFSERWVKAWLMVSFIATISILTVSVPIAWYVGDTRIIWVGYFMVLVCLLMWIMSD